MGGPARGTPEPENTPMAWGEGQPPPTQGTVRAGIPGRSILHEGVRSQEEWADCGLCQHRGWRLQGQQAGGSLGIS